jgi:acetoin utilization protein AcuB
MNLLDPVSKIMTKDLLCVQEDDTLSVVKTIFQKHRIHHIPVLKDGTLVGMLSKSDFSLFKNGFNETYVDKMIEEVRLNNYTARDIMTTKLARLNQDDRINVALEIFRENLFHAIPVVDGDMIVGMLTTYDIIKALADDNEAVAVYK